MCACSQPNLGADLFEQLGLDIVELRANGKDGQLVEWTVLQQHLQGIYDELQSMTSPVAASAVASPIASPVPAPAPAAASAPAQTATDSKLNNDEDGYDDFVEEVGTSVLLLR